MCHMIQKSSFCALQWECKPDEEAKIQFKQCSYVSIHIYLINFYKDVKLLDTTCVCVYIK
jgi:hypothetical protein